MLRCNSGLCSLPVRGVKLTDAEAIEAQVVELSVVGKRLLTSGSALRLHVNEVAETLRFRTCAQTQPGSHPATGKIPFGLRTCLGLLLRGNSGYA